MKITAERAPEAQMVLEVELDDERVKKSLDQASRRLAQRYRIPGFRKGRAPRAVVERTLGEEFVFEEAAERLIPEAYEEALKEQGLEAAGPPRLEILERKPVRFKATVPLPPEVDLGDYRSIAVKREQEPFTESEVEEQLLAIRRQHAVLEPVDRPPQMNDAVTADVKAEVEGEEILTQDGAQFHLREGMVVGVPGLAEALVGKAVGETHAIPIDVAEDWDDEEVAGKTVTFTVTIHDVKQENLPDADDALASEVSEEFETYAELRTRVAEDLRRRHQQQADNEYHEQVLEAVREKATLEYPPAIIDHEVEHMLQDMARQLGQDPRSFLGQDSPQLRQLADSMRPQAVDRLVRGLLLTEVAKAEGIEIADADVQAEIERLAADSPQSADQVRAIFDNESGHNALRQNLVTQRTLERLSEIAQANAENADDQSSGDDVHATDDGGEDGAEAPAAAGADAAEG